jgi:FkbM family methyltransferase
MSYLKTNVLLLEKIDNKYKEIKKIATKHQSKIPKVSVFWSAFQNIWQELIKQQNWLMLQNKSFLRKILEFFFPDRKRDYYFYSQSSILSQNQPVSLSFFPNLETFTTMYGFKMCCPTASDMSYALASGHYHSELSETLIFLRLVPHIQSFIDVGANIGFYSLLVTTESDKSIHIIAIEPDSENLCCLKKTLDENKFMDNITVLPVAIGERQKTAYLNKCLSGNSGNSLVTTSKHGFIQNQEKVKVDTLDNIYSKNRSLLKKSFVKIDVEGYEAKVLEGAFKWLSQENAPIIMFEAWPKSKKNNVNNHVTLSNTLNKFNYEIYAFQKACHNKSPLEKINIKNPSPSSNYLAIPKWANRILPSLIKPIDMRVFSSTSNLQSTYSFLKKSAENLVQEIDKK